MKPAIFHERVIAALIDLIIVSIAAWIICLPVFRHFQLEERLKDVQKQTLQMQSDPSNLDPEMLTSMLQVLVIISLLSIVLMIGMHAYYVYFESTTGQTPGKKLLGLRVVDLNGQPISRKQAMVREILRWYFDGLFILPAVIAIFATERRQRIGDLAAKTMVIDLY